MARHSGLQKEVLSHYRAWLKVVRSKPVQHRPAWFAFVSHQFRSPKMGGGLQKRDLAAIETLLRRTKRMLEEYESPSVKAVAPPIDAAHYPLNWIAKGGKAR